MTQGIHDIIGFSLFCGFVFFVVVPFFFVGQILFLLRSWISKIKSLLGFAKRF